MKKWTDRMETPIQAELICYDVNGIHIVFGVTKEKALKLFHFSSAPFDAENLLPGSRITGGRWRECGRLRSKRASSWYR